MSRVFDTIRNQRRAGFERVQSRIAETTSVWPWQSNVMSLMGVSSVKYWRDRSSAIIRFFSTREVLLVPLWLWKFDPGWMSLLGVAAYVLYEARAHKDMHSWGPFYHTHAKHHDEETPESGVPPWWVFVAFCVPWGAFWFGVFTCLCMYEFVHFLCHCKYRPITTYGWKVRVNHLQHHKLGDRYELMIL